MTTTKAASARHWHRAAGIALAGLMALTAGSAATAQNLVANGDFTHYVAPTANNPSTGLPYTSFLTRDQSVATNGGYLNNWTLTATNTGTTTSFGNASQLITGNDNNTMFQPVTYPNPISITQNSSCCLLAWSKDNVSAQYGDGHNGYSAAPDQVNNTWDGRGPNGANFWMTEATWNPTTLSQSLTGLQVGKQYTLDFDWAAGQLVYTSGATATNTAGWWVFIDNQYYAVGTALSAQGFSGWRDATFTFTATTSSTTLTFLPTGTGSPPLAMLSGISVTAVPEPETLLMFGFGLTALMLMRRRMR